MKRLAIAEPASPASDPISIGTIDQYVSHRIRRRRVMLGMTQHQLAELVGVTYQQAHKYEKGINRISSGRLYRIAQALGVEISYFYEGVDANGAAEPAERGLMPQQRALLDCVRNVSLLKNRKYQEVICHLTRVLSHRD